MERLAEPWGAVIGWGIGLLLTLLIGPLILKGLWRIVAHHLLVGLRERGWIVPRLRYSSAFQIVSSLIVFVNIPYVFLILFGYLTVLSEPDPWRRLQQGFGFTVFFPPLYGLYFVFVGAYWLQWLWQWIAAELFPRAVRDGLVQFQLRYRMAVLIMLLVGAVYFLRLITDVLTKLGSLLLR